MEVKSECMSLLNRAINDAIEYVGSANYPEREKMAKRAINECFRAAMVGDTFGVDFDSQVKVLEAKDRDADERAAQLHRRRQEGW